MAINGQQDGKEPGGAQPGSKPEITEPLQGGQPPQSQQSQGQPASPLNHNPSNMESRRPQGARGTAAMDPSTRKEVARKGGMAVSRNRQHMAEIGRKGGQSVSKNREHMAKIGRKGGAASRGHH